MHEDNVMHNYQMFSLVYLPKLQLLTRQSDTLNRVNKLDDGMSLFKDEVSYVTQSSKNKSLSIHYSVNKSVSIVPLVKSKVGHKAV